MNWLKLNMYLRCSSIYFCLKIQIGFAGNNNKNNSDLTIYIIIAVI